MEAFWIAMLALAIWSVFTITSCAVFALRAYLEERRARKCGGVA